MLKAILASVLFTTVAAPGQAQEIDNTAQIAAGRDLYMRHCATCHGLEADGDGPMAPILLVQPVALSALAANNGGEFPLLRAIRRIDGRDPLVSHGSSMPVYGQFFEGDDTAMKAPNGQPVMTSRPIADLVSYLLTIQQE